MKSDEILNMDYIDDIKTYPKRGSLKITPHVVILSNKPTRKKIDKDIDARINELLAMKKYSKMLGVIRVSRKWDPKLAQFDLSNTTHAALCRETCDFINEEDKNMHISSIDFGEMVTVFPNVKDRKSMYIGHVFLKFVHPKQDKFISFMFVKFPGPRDEDLNNYYIKNLA